MYILSTAYKILGMCFKSRKTARGIDDITEISFI